MLRVAALVVVACAAVGCEEEPHEVTVIGAVDVADGCAQGARRFLIDTVSAADFSTTFLLCDSDGSFHSTLDAFDWVDLAVDAFGCGPSGDDASIGEAAVRVDGSAGVADVGTIVVPIGGCP
jgi:hypothetical protein